jgi:hypothetical protein
MTQDIVREIVNDTELLSGSASDFVERVSELLTADSNSALPQASAHLLPPEPGP